MFERFGDLNIYSPEQCCSYDKKKLEGTDSYRITNKIK